MKNEYKIDPQDLTYLVNSFEYDMAILLINNNNLSYLHVNSEKFNDMTKIIPFYETEENGLCNILIDYENSFTMNEFSENKKLMKLIDSLLKNLK